MEKKVAQFIEQHKLIKQNSTVCLGVSGGPDSMALLHYFVSIRAQWQLQLIVLAADHQLRGTESQADLTYVEQICRKWDVQFVGERLDVQAYKKAEGVGTQVAAREQRYRFFAEQMAHFAADYLALGHHGDDQVETMLMRFTRSANTASLSGIPVKRQFATGYLVRPFLCLPKSELESYCQMHGIQPRIDPSNQDTAYTRNYFRKHILPLFKAENNNIHTTAQRLSIALRDDEHYLQQEAKKMLAAVVNMNENAQTATFEIKAFKSYALSLQRRVFHLILYYLYDKLPENLSYVHEDIFFNMLQEKTPYLELDFPHQLRIEKSYGHVVFTFSDAENDCIHFHELLTVPGCVTLPDGSRITASYTDTKRPSKPSDDLFICSAGALTLPLHVRTRQPGDRMTWKGLTGRKKVKDIFIDEKIHRRKREQWPIVTDDSGHIVWLVGLKKDNRMLTEATTYIQLAFDGNRK